jgi:acyl dehydratase
VGLYYEDLDPGQTFVSPARTVTEADIVNFCGVSGDFNPLHSDEEFARGTGYGRRIAHGVLVLSVATGLRQRTGVFDGTLMGLLEIRSWSFRRAVFPGDTVRTTTEVTELRETSKADRGIVIQKVTVINQHDEVVQEGEFVLMVRRRSE